MSKDRRTKAELLAALDKAMLIEEKLLDDMGDTERLLRKANVDKDAAEGVVDKQRKLFESIRQAIKTAVALKYPQTVAFGGVEQVWYEGQYVHPGYEGDNAEVRLLKLIDDECHQALNPS